jgi:hypothetical protein
MMKIDDWFSNRKEASEIVKINPRFLGRSPVNIFRATKFTVEPPSLPSIDDDHHVNMKKN